jgi:uncharacterized protein
MKIEGAYKIPAPRPVVWQALMDPEVLAHSMYGCEKLEPNPDGSFHAELGVGIAAVKGKYRARIELLDLAPPERYRMKVQGQGMGGFMEGEGTLTLAEQGAETQVNYSGEVQVGGAVASVGQRLILAAARQIVNHFFGEFTKQVTARMAPPISAGGDLSPSPPEARNKSSAKPDPQA